MNSIKMAALIIGVVLPLPLYAESWGADWQAYGRSEASIFYYDVGSIKEVSSGVFQVWEKREALRKEIERAVRVHGGRYKALNHTITLTAIDCGQKKSRLLEATAYEKDGNVLQSFNFEDMTKWGHVFPQSSEEILLKRICK